MTHNETIGGIPLEFIYTHQEHGGKKFPKILSILFNDYDLTEIIDHTVVEQIKSHIFKELNGDISNK